MSPSPSESLLFFSPGVFPFHGVVVAVVNVDRFHLQQTKIPSPLSICIYSTLPCRQPLDFLPSAPPSILPCRKSPLLRPGLPENPHLRLCVSSRLPPPLLAFSSSQGTSPDFFFSPFSRIQFASPPHLPTNHRSLDRNQSPATPNDTNTIDKQAQLVPGHRRSEDHPTCQLRSPLPLVTLSVGHRMHLVPRVELRNSHPCHGDATYCDLSMSNSSHLPATTLSKTPTYYSLI